MPCFLLCAQKELIMTNPTTKSLGKLRAWSREGRSLLLDCGGPQLAVTVLTPRIVRVRLAPEGAFAPRRSWAVNRPDEDFPQTDFEIQENQAGVELHTDVLQVRIERDPCRLAFTDNEGRRFCADESGPYWGENVWGSDGVGCRKRIEGDEHFYGFGERTGPLERSGRQMVNWTVDALLNQGTGTDPLYAAIPVFLSLRPGLAYGFYFNNTWRSRFQMGRNEPDVWSVDGESGELDYYVIYGPAPADALEGVGMLLGTTPLPPRWALGYHQSRYGYESEAVVRDIATQFRERDIPCDVIHLDIEYMDGYRVFTFDPETFPDPGKLVADLGQRGFRVVPIVDPGVKVEPGYEVYQQGLERDAFVRTAGGEIFEGYAWPDDAAFSDYTRPDVREWWGDLHQRFVEHGISGIWNDMNEPTLFERPFSQIDAIDIEMGEIQPGTIDLDAIQGPNGERTTHAEVHNLYGSGMAQACYEGLRRHLNGERPFVLTRSAFAGIQRWSACWMGDNNSWWDHLEMAMPQLMNVGLSGVPFVGVDVGGFADNATGELFARWMQFGVLTPFCRGHTLKGTIPHEPWAFGARVEKICREYLQLRYRLLPYIYTLFWEASQRGAPVLRPLLYHFPNDPATYHLHDQVMLGPFLMAAPVYRAGREHRHVYLPAGEWYDWWTDELIQGPTHRLARAPLEKMPLYVRAGAILPSGPDLRYVDEHPLDPLTLDLYPGDGTFRLYEDDGLTFAYETGEFCTTRYRLRREEGRLHLDIGAREGSYVPPQRRLILRFHAVNQPAAWDHPDARYDAESRLLVFELDDDGQSSMLDLNL